MGENLEAEGRFAVRTPMQWSAGRNGGFSTAAPAKLPGPVVEGGFSPEHINVAQQRRDPESLLNFMSLLIRRYRECPELGWGHFGVLDQPHRAVMAHRCDWDGQAVVALHNLSAEPRTVPLALEGCDENTRLGDLLCDGNTATDSKGRVEIQLEGYGYRWLRVVQPGDRGLA